MYKSIKVLTVKFKPGTYSKGLKCLERMCFYAHACTHQQINKYKLTIFIGIEMLKEFIEVDTELSVEHLSHVLEEPGPVRIIYQTVVVHPEHLWMDRDGWREGGRGREGGREGWREG